MTSLRALGTADLAALLALQHAFTGMGPRWSADKLERELFDPARDHGRQVVVAERGGQVVGGAGWVEAGAQMFGAPVLAADADAAGALIDHLIRRALAVGATALRVSTTALDLPKIEALSARGGVRLFDFVTVARAAEPIEPPVSPLRRVELAGFAPEAMRDLYNETFAGLPNAPALDDAGVAHALAAMWPQGSGVWLDASGEAAGFVWGARERDGDAEHAVVDSVGVRAPWRGRRVGALLVAHLVTAAARAGIAEVRALIASTNVASLALHRAIGFAERSCVTVWELRPGIAEGEAQRIPTNPM